jgi:hypothetical protein
MDEGSPGLELADGGLTYVLVFDDSLDADADTTAITCTNGDSELFPLKNILFLGSEVEIKCSDFDGAMTVSLGTRTTLTQGQTITHGDYQVTLTGLDTRSGVDKALITVTKGGSSESVSLQTDDVGTVFNGGLSVKIKSTFQGSAGAQATIVAGTALDDTVTDGEEYQGLEDWHWTIDKGVSSKPELGVTFEPVDSLTGEDMLREDDSLDFPGDTLSIVNRGLTINNIGSLQVDSKTATTAYVAGTKLSSVEALEVDFTDADNDKTDDFTVADVGKDEMPVNATDSLSSELVSAEAIRLYYDGSAGADVWVTYKDPADSKWKEGANYTANAANHTIAMLRADTTLIYVTVTTGDAIADQALLIEVRDPTTPTTIIDQLWLALDVAAAPGVEVSDAETGSLVYTFLGTVDAGWGYGGDYSNNDDGFFTQWGLQVDDPKSDIEGKRLRIDVPNDRQKVEVMIGSTAGASETELGVGDDVPGTTATIKSVNAAGAKSMQVVPISAPIAKLDSEVSDTEKTSTNMVLFGGPAVNLLVRQLGIQGTEFKSAAGNPIGKIKLVSGAFGGPYTAAVIAGWDAVNTRMASWVFAHYQNYASTFAGKSEVTVSGTTTSALTVA